MGEHAEDTIDGTACERCGCHLSGEAPGHARRCRRCAGRPAPRRGTTNMSEEAIRRRLVRTREKWPDSTWGSTLRDALALVDIIDARDKALRDMADQLAALLFDDGLDREMGASLYTDIVAEVGRLLNAGGREPGCKCQWEEGDSPCPVHGEEEDAPCA